MIKVDELLTNEITMKSKIHIATKEYCFIEIEHDHRSDKFEEIALDVSYAHDHLQNIINDKEGLDASEWKKVRTIMLNTGECDPNLNESMSKAQRFWVNQTKLGLRDIKSNQLKK